MKKESIKTILCIVLAISLMHLVAILTIEQWYSGELEKQIAKRDSLIQKQYSVIYNYKNGRN